MQSYDLTAGILSERDPELAIIPIGSIEQHGPHLPVATDWYIATALGQGVAGVTGGFLIPALPISTCREHMGLKGSLWMDPNVFYDMLTSILLSLREQGFKKVGLLQCHGGVFMITPVIRQVNATNNPDFMVANVDICEIFTTLSAEGIVESKTELHAGEIETSLMLHIAPDTVHMDLAVDFVPSAPRSYLSYGSIYRLSPTGVWGEPTLAEPGKGVRILERCIELAAMEMEKSFSFMQNKEMIGYSSY